MTRWFNKKALQLHAMGMSVLLSSPALAQVNTAGTSLNQIQSWLMTWIPAACVLIIIVGAIAWMMGLMRMDWAVRLIVGMIVIGSASYLVGLFGLSGGGGGG